MSLVWIPLRLCSTSRYSSRRKKNNIGKTDVNSSSKRREGTVSREETDDKYKIVTQLQRVDDYESKRQGKSKYGVNKEMTVKPSLNKNLFLFLYIL